MTAAAAPPGAAPGSTAALRTANQQRVLDVLRTQGASAGEAPLTQAELARVTGLAAATVSNIVRALAASGLVDTVPGSGRRGTAVRLARRAGVVGGVDFGHSHVAVALGDLSGALIARRRQRLDAGRPSSEGLDAARALLDDLLAEQGLRPRDVRTVGLGLPAPLDDGVVQSSAILPGWVGVHAGEAAAARFDVDVHVENDANLGALGEQRQGAGRDHATVVFVKVSSGVGAGIVIDDRLFRGAGGMAGELGHLTLDESGPVCRCGGRGCLEAYTSIRHVVAMMEPQLPGASFDDVVAAARDGNVSALRTLEDAGLHLGWGLASVVNLLNPGVVVVGGDMARAGDLVLDAVRVGLRRHALDAVATTPVVRAALGSDAALVGAVLLAAERTPLLTA